MTSDERAARIIAKNVYDVRLTVMGGYVYHDPNQIRKAIAVEIEDASAEQRDAKDGEYLERNRLVALLASLYPSSMEPHPDDGRAWDAEWRWIIFVDLPAGQATWHIHDSHHHLFDHVPRNQGRVWDGHTTDEKYERVAALCRA